MPEAVNMGSMIECSFGAAPSSLMVTPENKAQGEFTFAANIMDHKPFKNILPFGTCSSMANPTTAAATSAALGVLTPTPCVPATSSPWTPGASTVMLGNQPALDSTSTCMCNWAGVISITQCCTTIEVP